MKLQFLGRVEYPGTQRRMAMRYLQSDRVRSMYEPTMVLRYATKHPRRRDGICTHAGLDTISSEIRLSQGRVIHPNFCPECGVPFNLDNMIVDDDVSVMIRLTRKEIKYVNGHEIFTGDARNYVLDLQTRLKRLLTFHQLGYDVLREENTRLDAELSALKNGGAPSRKKRKRK